MIKKKIMKINIKIRKAKIKTMPPPPSDLRVGEMQRPLRRDKVGV